MSFGPDAYLHVLYDRSGRILAAVQLDDRSGSRAPLPRPAAQRGQLTADLRVPAEARQKDLVAVCAEYIVRGKGERATLVARKGKPRERSTTASRKRAR
jgi:hypothetical protein